MWIKSKKKIFFIYGIDYCGRSSDNKCIETLIKNCLICNNEGLLCTTCLDNNFL